MSDFLAEARIVVRPDTSRFAAELAAQLKAVTSTPIPISVVPVVAPGAAAAAAATATLSSAQQQARTSTLGLMEAAELENTAFGQQATILRGATVGTQQLAAAQLAGRDAAIGNAAANAAVTSNLKDARRGLIANALSLIGLRGAALAASGGFLAASAASIAFAKSLSLAANFERQLNVFRVTADATADDMERVSEAARQLGRDITLPGVSAGDAAQTMTELAKAGLSVKDSLDAARGTLQLATAAQIDNAQATELVANALNTFKLQGSEAARVADLLAGAARESQGSIVDMGIALRQVAPVAALVNFSVEDTVTILTQLARSGLSASDAGTSFRQALLRLIQNMPKVNAEVDRLGLNLRDVNGFIRPEVFGELTKELNKMTPAAREASIAALGGADAIRTFGLLARDGADAFLETRDAITEVGLAQEAAAAQTVGLTGDVENLKNQMSALGLTFGDLAKGPVGAVTAALAEQAAALNEVLEVAVEFGAEFNQLGKEVEDTVPFLDRGADALKKYVLLQPALLAIGPAAAGAVIGVKLFGEETEKSAVKVDQFDFSVNRVLKSLAALSNVKKAPGGRPATGFVADELENILKGFDAQEVRARIADSNQQLLDVLTREQEFLERQLGRQFVQNRPALARTLEQQLLGVVRDINSIQDQAVAEAERGAREREGKARDAEAAARAADQALLGALGLGRDRQQNAISAAALTPGLRDDIREQQEFRSLILQQVAEIKKQITDRQAQKVAVVALTAILTSVKAALKTLREQQQAVRQAARDALTEKIQKRLQLAELRGDTDVILAALNAAIKDAQKRVAAAKKAKKGILDEQIALQQLINQRNELLKTATEGSKDNQAAKFFFEQLQAQQGFASNLLGNLIPSGQTAGLVGIPSPASVGKAGVSGDIVQAALGARTAAQEGKGQTSPSAGQASTTNEILRRILRVLEVMNRGAETPEANYQAWVGGSAMTGGGGNTEVM